MWVGSYGCSRPIFLNSLHIFVASFMEESLLGCFIHPLCSLHWGLQDENSFAQSESEQNSQGARFSNPGRSNSSSSVPPHTHACTLTHTHTCARTFQPASADVLPCVRWLHFLALWLDWGGALNSPPGRPGLVPGRGRNRTALGFTETLRAHLCGPAPCWWEKEATWTKGPSLEGTHPSNPVPQDVIGSINITSYLLSSPQLLFISLFSFFPCWFFSVFSLFHSYFFKKHLKWWF